MKGHWGLGNSILDFGLTIAQRKAFSTLGCANGMASLPWAAPTLRASPRTPAGKQATHSVS
ncbi:hypothetical protein [Nostoc sp.]|uniref:hypothetical protein n=1 Tax=Nostoc sp. TaxID=1180 RepID=UPI002FF466D6